MSAAAILSSVWLVKRTGLVEVCWNVKVGGFIFFQAEDGIRDVAVTGVQTCALPISTEGLTLLRRVRAKFVDLQFVLLLEAPDNQRAVEAAEFGAFQSLIKPIRPHILEKIGRASCRERV